MGHKPFSSHAGEVLMSTETNNLLLSTLSAGIVGVGDPIGSESATNLFQTIRADGVIVKPESQLCPLMRRTSRTHRRSTNQWLPPLITILAAG
jgi:hypothetical protein